MATGYVRWSRPNPKKIPQTDSIFANIRDKDGHSSAGDNVKRLSMDCKATVNVGNYSRGGTTRGDTQAANHDMGCEEKHTPFGVVDEDSGQLHIAFGSSAKTSDFIMDSLEAYWASLPHQERAAIDQLQIKNMKVPMKLFASASRTLSRRNKYVRPLRVFSKHLFCLAQ